MTTPASGSPTVVEYTRLISLAVHEMRTPASVVGGYLRMLQSDTSAPLDERHRRMIEEAGKACARLVALIGELGEVGKLDAGIAPVTVESFDIFELVRDVAANVHEVLDREVRLETHGLASGGAVSGDRTRLRTALDLVIRAVMREQPAATTVVVDSQRVEHDGRPAARLVVAPSSDVQRASEAQASDFDEHRGGLGLGLPIARRVIARLGGRIWSPAAADGARPAVGSRGAIVIAVPLAE